MGGGQAPWAGGGGGRLWGELQVWGAVLYVMEHTWGFNMPKLQVWGAVLYVMEHTWGFNSTGLLTQFCPTTLGPLNPITLL